MTALVFTVLGEVAPQGSKTRGRHGGLFEDNPKTKPWRKTVTAAAEVALAETPKWNTEAEYLRVSLMFAIKRPKSHYRTGRFSEELKPDAPVYCNKYPDIDKAARAILDSLKVAGAITDDSQVVQLHCRKTYATVSEPGVIIAVREVEDGEIP